jgi:uncharacterized damage-inducible protein DinB
MEMDPMPVIEAMLTELDQEAQTTRRFLLALPEDRLAWRPHPRSWSLGQLALHLAETPARAASLTQVDSVPVPEFGHADQPASKAEILEAFERSLLEAHRLLEGMTDDRAVQPWRLLDGDTAVMTVPRIGLVRTIVLNHSYHHRGQLTVYLRLLDVPVPAAYGASADEDRFRPRMATVG